MRQDESGSNNCLKNDKRLGSINKEIPLRGGKDHGFLSRSTGVTAPIRSIRQIRIQLC
jgi:hypothetical protein